MSEPTASNHAARILASIPEITPEQLATWPESERDAYLQARAELMHEAEQLEQLDAARRSPAALLTDMRQRSKVAAELRAYEELRAAADQAHREALEEHGGETRVARIDLVDGGAVILRAPTEKEVEDLETKLLRLGQQGNATKAAAESAQAQRWAWEACIVYPEDHKTIAAKYPMIWGDIRRAHNALGRGVEDDRRGKF